MITRHYFMSVEKPHDDGKGSYTFDCVTMSHKSLFPNPKYVFEDAGEYFEKKLSDSPGDKIKVLSFSRI